MKSPFTFGIGFSKKTWKTQILSLPLPGWVILKTALQVCEELGPRQQDPNKDGVWTAFLSKVFHCCDLQND